MNHRNTPFIVAHSIENYGLSRTHNLVNNTIHERNGKYLTLNHQQKVIDFINCSYLGLDVHPNIIEAYRSVEPSLGVNFCCARTRLSMRSLLTLEERLSHFFGGKVVTFPSVTATHLSVIPLLTSGVLLNAKEPPKIHAIFDKFSHASMQFLIPIIEKEARVSIIGHNDLKFLKKLVIESRKQQEIVVYFADGIYSMGGACPVQELLTLSQQENFYLYIDDAHGTSLFGEHGQGFVLSHISGELPSNLFITFSMTKGFGVAGGGIILSNATQEQLIRTYGMIYAFSAPLDFASTQAAHAALDLHLDGTVGNLQKILHEKATLFDSLMNSNESCYPIKMVFIGDEKRAINIGKKLLDDGFFTVVAFFPIVAQGKAQLRICLSTQHANEDIKKLTQAIKTYLSNESIHAN